MKAPTTFLPTARLNMLARHSKTACATIFLQLVLFLMPFAGVKAQVNYLTNNGTITITAYCTVGAAAIPTMIDGLPVTSVGNYGFKAAAA